MARLYADEDFDYAVVEELRRQGHDVLTVQEAGHSGRDDANVLAVASSLGRAVLTHNRVHFIRLHRQIRPHSGIVVCTRDKNIAALATRIHHAVTNCPSLDNQLFRVNRPPAP